MPPYDRAFKEQCIQLVRDGASIADVARDNDISDWSLSRWTRAAGICLRRKHTTEFKEQQIQRVRDGASIAQVSRDCGVHYKILATWTREAGLSLKTEYTNELKHQLLAQITGGVSVRSVAKASGVPYPVLKEWCSIAGVTAGGKTRKKGIRGEQNARAIELLKQGLSQSEIARRLEVDASWVCRVARQLRGGR